MGTTGTGIWESDDALDFLATLGKKPKKQAVLGALAAAQDPEHTELGGADNGVCALCAAELIAAAAGKLPPPKKIELDWTASPDEVALAARVIENVAIYSALAALWDEVHEYETWVTALDPLRKALGAAPLARKRPAFESTRPKVPSDRDFELAIDAMNAGVVRASLFRRDLKSDKAGLKLFARANPAESPTGAQPAAEPFRAGDLERLAGRPIHCSEEEYLLDDPAKWSRSYSLADLAPVLLRAERCALLAGGEVMSGERFARNLMPLLELLGGDAEAGVLSLVAGRKKDPDGSFGRALAFVHACGVWAVAAAEAGDAAPKQLAAAAPLLVLARFRLRLRAAWDPAVDLSPRTRFPAWSKQPAAVLAEVSRRADVLADFVAACEAPGAKLPAAPAIAVGSLVLQKKFGVTLACSPSGPQVLVGRFGQPRKPYLRVASSFATAIALPAAAGRIVLGIPTDLPK